MAFEPMSKEDLLAQGECCGNKCINCPYIQTFERINENSEIRMPKNTVLK